MSLTGREFGSKSTEVKTSADSSCLACIEQLQALNSRRKGEAINAAVLVAGGGPVGLTLARVLGIARRATCWSSADAIRRAIPRWTSPTAARWSCSGAIGLVDKRARRRRGGGEQLRRLLDHLADRSRAAPLPLSQRHRKAGRDREHERRHPAARARHAGQPGDDRAGAARSHPASIRWSTPAGAWRFEDFQQDADGVTADVARRRDRRHRAGALRLPRRVRRRLEHRARQARHRPRRPRGRGPSLHDPLPLSTRATSCKPSASPGTTRQRGHA